MRRMLALMTRSLRLFPVAGPGGRAACGLSLAGCPGGSATADMGPRLHVVLRPDRRSRQQQGRGAVLHRARRLHWVRRHLLGGRGAPEARVFRTISCSPDMGTAACGGAQSVSSTRAIRPMAASRQRASRTCPQAASCKRRRRDHRASAQRKGRTAQRSRAASGSPHRSDRRHRQRQEHGRTPAARAGRDGDRRG